MSSEFRVKKIVVLRILSECDLGNKHGEMRKLTDNFSYW